MTEEIKLLLKDYIQLDWSPEQIVGRLEKDGIIKLHHETVYQYILTDKQSGGFCINIFITKGKHVEKIMFQPIITMES